MRVKGIDTIIPSFSQGTPRRVELPLGAMQAGQYVSDQWYSYGMAMLPFCAQCRTPLDWYRPPEGDVLLVCPNCGKEWVKDNQWLRQEESMFKGRRH